jgi:hypothetical protein
MLGLIHNVINGGIYGAGSITLLLIFYLYRELAAEPVPPLEALGLIHNVINGGARTMNNK